MAARMHVRRTRVVVEARREDDLDLDGAAHAGDASVNLRERPATADNRHEIRDVNHARRRAEPS